MKKLYILLAMVLVTSMTFAQTFSRSGIPTDAHKANGPQILSTKAIGDTLMFFNGNGFFVNSTDNPNFQLLNEDYDGFTTANNMCKNWCYYFSLDLAKHGRPGDVDSAKFIGATSWFNPIGKALNWFAFGPLTIPTTGAVLRWHNRNNPGYTDGYQVSLSKTGKEITHFNDDYIFKKNDNASPPGADTLWTQRSVGIPANLAGQQIYIAFIHNANDMDVLWLDHFLLITANNLGVDENSSKNFEVYQNNPNPSKGTTSIGFQLQTAAKVNIAVHDLAGRLVENIDLGQLSNGIHAHEINTSDFGKGMYFYTVTVNKESVTRKMIVN